MRLLLVFGLGDRAYYPTFHPEGSARGTRSLGRTDVNDHVGHLLRCEGAFYETVGTIFHDELNARLLSCLALFQSFLFEEVLQAFRQRWSRQHGIDRNTGAPQALGQC